MISDGTPEELFRFSIVRNPVSLTGEERIRRTLRVLDSQAAEQYPYYSALLKLRQQNVTRDVLIANANRLLSDAGFQITQARPLAQWQPILFFKFLRKGHPRF